MTSQLGVQQTDTNIIVLHEKLSNYNVENKAYIYYDYQHKENIQTIVHKQALFTPYSREDVPGKFVRGRYTNWIHFQVNNPTQDTFYLCMEGYLSLDSIWLFKDGQLVSFHRNAHPVQHDKYGIIKVPLTDFSMLAIPSKGDYDILIKDYHSQYVTGNNIPRLFNAYLFDGDYYSRHYFKIFFFEGSFLVLFTFVILFGFQAFSTRDRSMFWYAFYAFVCMVITYRNLESINPWFYFTKNWLFWKDTRVLQTALVFFAYIRFLQEVLEIKNHPKLYRIFRYVYVFIVTSVIVELGLMLCFDEHEYYRFLNYWILRVAITVIGVYYIRVIYNSGSKYAHYILIGVIIMLFTEAITWFFGGSLSSLISLLGIYLEFIIFSLVLSMKSRDIVIAKSQLEHHNQTLQYDNLNIAKNMESRIAKDLHDDVGGALISVKFLLQNGENTKDSLEKSKSLIDEIQDNIRQQIFILNPENRYLAEFLPELRSITSKYCHTHNLSFEYDEKISSSIPINKIKGTSMRNIFMIIKELLNNTFKHSNGDKVSLYIMLSDQHLVIRYADSGRNDAGSEVGSGNGLLNIAKRVQEEKGSITTRKDEGWETTLTFPLAVILDWE